MFRARRIFFAVLPFLSLALVWEVVAWSGFISQALFPPSSKVLASLLQLSRPELLLTDLFVSLYRALTGLLVGSLLGVVLGLMTGRSVALHLFFSPLMHMFRSFPPVALIPLFIIWFGIGDFGKILSIAFAVFFPVWISAHSGAERVPAIYLWSARLLDSSRFRLVRKVIFPAAMPFIVSGVRIGIGVAFIMVFVSELAGASSGLGYRISITQLAYRIDQMIAVLLTLGILGFFVDSIWLFLARKLFPWINTSSHLHA